jgi:hypothetical protein
MIENNEKLIAFLNKCGIVFSNFVELNNMIIPRETFVSQDKYNEIKLEIVEIKTIFSSSSLTCLQTDAPKNQKWPLLNLVRQILKALDYTMNPIRKSAGYNEKGQKKYNRFFRLEKIKKLPKKLNLNIENLNSKKMT